MVNCKAIIDGQRCPTRASQGFHYKHPEFCAKHKEKGMVNVVSPRCKEEGCRTAPHYNFEGEKPLYCGKHKDKNMINVTLKTPPCQEKGCKVTQPTFNYPGTEKALYCSLHKLEGMVDVKNKQHCVHKNCTTHPSYNYEGKEVRLYCAKHKKEGMIDVTKPSCKHKDCKLLPSFNYNIGDKPLYCNKHKKEGMISVKKKCRHEGCNVIPNYGITKATHCKKHKTEEMKDVRHKSCKNKDCDKRPNFNYEGEKGGIYCFEHKKENMIDVVHKRCKSEWCDLQVTKKYEGYCYHCFVHLFPDHKLSRSYNTKEKAVAKYITKNFPDVDVHLDKRIDGGCSLKRPDMLIDMGSHVIIIEVDEHQHGAYDTTCENKRIMIISKDLNHRPIVVVRFNPDKYTRNKKLKVSCWKTTMKGTFVIKTQKEKWEKRLDLLKQWVEYFMEEIPEKSVSYKYLFYDK